MWTTTDGYVLRLPRPVLERLVSETGASEHEVLSELERGAGSARRVGSLQARKIGRNYPVFRADGGRGSFHIVTRPIKGGRPIPGPRGLAGPYAIVGVSDRFRDPDDDDPAVPSDDPDPGRAPRDPARGAAERWRGPLPLAAAARLPGGGVCIVEDERGQPVYVGQTASFARRLAHIAARFAGHRVRVMRVARPPLDVLGAVGAAVVRAVRGAPRGGAPGVLPRGHAYGASLPARPVALRVERTVRTVATVPRRPG